MYRIPTPCLNAFWHGRPYILYIFGNVFSIYYRCESPYTTCSDTHSTGVGDKWVAATMFTLRNDHCNVLSKLTRPSQAYCKRCGWHPLIGHQVSEQVVHTCIYTSS